MTYQVSTISESGLKKRLNEDSVLTHELDGGILCVICDGLGGQTSAAKASDICINTIKSYFTNQTCNNYLTRVKDSILEANTVLYNLTHKEQRRTKMATTADVLFLKDHYMYWGHIGDSRIYDLKNGSLYQLTKDHSLVQQMLDTGFLTVKDASRHPNKNIIMRALGEHAKIDVDLSKVILNSKDKHRFLACTDGVTAVISDDELEGYLQEPDIEECLSTIAKEVVKRGAPDDYSMIIIEPGV